MEEPGRLQSIGLQRVGHDWVTALHFTRLVITFLPRSKRLLISWLQSPSAVILEAKKIKSVIVSPSICHEVMGPDAIILVFWTLSFNAHSRSEKKSMTSYAGSRFRMGEQERMKLGKECKTFQVDLSCFF